MKIVIADDERLSRVQLLKLIEDLPASWQVVGEADNGEALVELIGSRQPDIAIVDIRMPKMDGIAAIKAGQRLSPMTKWIVLSGFSDFSYAQQALRLGVSEYLLKPVHPNELEAALDAVSRENKQYRQLLNKQFENDLVSLFHGLSSFHHEPANSLMRRSAFAGCLFYFDGALSDRQWTDWQSEFNRAVKSLIQETIQTELYTAFIAMPGGELSLIGACDSGSPKSAFLAAAIGEATSRLLRQFRDTSVKVTALQTENCESFAVLNEQLELLRERSYLRSVLGINRQWTYRSFLKTEAPGSLQELARQLIEIVQAYKDKVYLPFQNGIAGLQKKWKQAGWLEGCDVPGHIANFLSSTMNISPKKTADLPLLTAELNHYGKKLLEESGQSENRMNDIVDQVISIIGEKYMNDIGLGQLASELNISQNYLSMLFHKKTGTTFMKYLTRIRILAAKQLLSETNLQVQQVAARVGYYSTRHFSKLFREAEGCHPSEYRKKLEKMR